MPVLYRNKGWEQSCLPSSPVFLASRITKGSSALVSHLSLRPAAGCQLNEESIRSTFLLKVFINDLGVSVGMTHSAALNFSKRLLPPKIITKAY